MQFEMYNTPALNQSSAPVWRWRLVKKPQNIVIANSANTFKNEKECEANIHIAMLASYDTPIIKPEVSSPLDETFRAIFEHPKLATG